MKKIPLLPRYFRWIGLVLLLSSLLSYLIGDTIQNLRIKTFVFVNGIPMGDTGSVFFQFMEVDFGLTLLLFVSLSGLACMAFSRNRQEDEMIDSVRLFAWSWTVLSMVFLFLCIILFIYGFSYLYLAFFTPHLLLLIYLLIFHFQLYKLNRKDGKDEE